MNDKYYNIVYEKEISDFVRNLQYLSNKLIYNNLHNFLQPFFNLLQ